MKGDGWLAGMEVSELHMKGQRGRMYQLYEEEYEQ